MLRLCDIDKTLDLHWTGVIENRKYNYGFSCVHWTIPTEAQ